jgi:hypothetical protein
MTRRCKIFTVAGVSILAQCFLSGGEIEPAIIHLNQSLEIFQRLGMAPDVDRVRTRLVGLAAA